jgi:glycosyltransferase involved in cell wall biosynthesis
VKRLCFVLPSLSGGGAERVAVTVLNGLSAARWDRSLYLYKRQGPYLGAVSPSVRVASGDDDNGRGRLTRLRRYFEATDPDIIVAFLSYASVLAAARLARSRARIVFNLGTPVSAFLQDPDYRWSRPLHRAVFTTAARVAYRQADAVIATSAGVRDDLRDSFGVDGSRMKVIHNPVDLAAIEDAARQPLDNTDAALWKRPVLVAAGRLAEAKNVPLLIAALAALRERVDARLFILGAGDHESAIRDQITSLGLSGVATLCGFKSNPWRYLARADVFVLTSTYEGFGNVLVEAMACGVPVVATASAGTREVVEDGVNGLLVEAHTATAVAAALERILADRSLRERLAAGARASAGAYAVPAIIKQYEATFDGLAA